MDRNDHFHKKTHIFAERLKRIVLKLNKNAKNMGLSFHYSGRFKKEASLSEMIREIKDIADVYHWEYFIFDRQFPENTLGKTTYNDRIYGINFTPPDCETISICFLSNGRMSGPTQLKFYGNTQNEKEKDYLYMLSVKTQFAGIEVHKLVIQLFKHLNKKYFQDFKMIDEGQYWETGDEVLLQKIFDRYDEIMDSFTFALKNFPKQPKESFESYFERVINMVNKNRKDD